jgi:hypothetical protein
MPWSRGRCKKKTIRRPRHREGSAPYPPEGDHGTAKRGGGPRRSTGRPAGVTPTTDRPAGALTTAKSSKRTTRALSESQHTHLFLRSIIHTATSFVRFAKGTHPCREGGTNHPRCRGREDFVRRRHPDQGTGPPPAQATRADTRNTAKHGGGPPRSTGRALAASTGQPVLPSPTTAEPTKRTHARAQRKSTPTCFCVQSCAPRPSFVRFAKGARQYIFVPWSGEFCKKKTPDHGTGTQGV